MARSFKARPIDTLESLARQSGWYLAAWRDFSELTLDQLVEKTGISKSMLSELETGNPRKNGEPPRYNKDTIAKMADALGIAKGRLFDVNPFVVNPSIRLIEDGIHRLDDRDRDEVARLVDTLLRRHGPQAA